MAAFVYNLAMLDGVAAQPVHPNGAPLTAAQFEDTVEPHAFVERQGRRARGTLVGPTGCRPSRQSLPRG